MNRKKNRVINVSEKGNISQFAGPKSNRMRFKNSNWSQRESKLLRTKKKKKEPNCFYYILRLSLARTIPGTTTTGSLCITALCQYASSSIHNLPAAVEYQLYTTHTV